LLWKLFRADSKPFSYIRSNAPGSSRGTSRNISRASSREGLSQPGLESPGNIDKHGLLIDSCLDKSLNLAGILRKIMGSGPGTGTDSESGSRPITPSYSSGNNFQPRSTVDFASNIYSNQV